MDYSKKKREELIDLCKEKGVKGYSGKSKSDLIKLLSPPAPETQSQIPITPTQKITSSITFEQLNDNIRISHGDCLEVMKSIPDNSVNLILCDLPYGSTKCKWDSVIDIDKLWKEYQRILIKPTGVIALFAQQPFTTKLISGNYDWYKYNLIWKKNKTTQFLLANYRPMKCTEDICVFSPGGAAAASRTTGNMTYNPQNLKPVNIVKKNSEKRIGKMLNQIHHLGQNNKLISNTEYKQSFTNYPTEILEFDIEYDTIHETQKPVKLIEYLIKTYSNEGEMVLDNTMGSGTTGIGCVLTNRKFIGIELEKKYFDLSKERLLKSISGSKEPEPESKEPEDRK
jgi:site-specific DNA-methyltransferase (adenine-specific)